MSQAYCEASDTLIRDIELIIEALASLRQGQQGPRTRIRISRTPKKLRFKAYTRLRTSL